MLPISLGRLWIVSLLLSVVLITAAEADVRVSRRIALVSDPHIDASGKNAEHAAAFERVIDEVNASGVDAVLIAGDLTQSGKTEAFDRFAAMVKRFTAPGRWIAGNHDVGGKPGQEQKGAITSERLSQFEARLGSSVYATDILTDLHVIGINSSLFGSKLAAEEAQWKLIENELTGRKQRWTVLLMHYPAFVARPDEPDDYFNLDAGPRQRLCDAIQRSGADAVFSGHLHRPLDAKVCNVPVIGAPAVSFGLPRGNQRVGWTLVTLSEAGIQREDRYLASPSERVQAFYYTWYGAPPFQPDYRHWQQGGHTPPHAIGANFYPRLGPYSSTDPAVLKQHMQWLRQAGIGTLCVTWWGRGSFEDRCVPAVLDAAAAAGLKVSFHLEPYANATPASFADDIRFILSEYGKHPAFYRASNLGNKPVFYIFESNRQASAEWKTALAELRGDASEPFLLLAQTSDLRFVEEGGFDGGYPYDGLAPFKIPTFLTSWPLLAERFAAAGKIFVPSVGPGYWDDRAVPNGADEPAAARSRDDGRATTYDAAWQQAIRIRPPIITITSFNEWHEGSQIEPAVAKSTAEYDYPAYSGGEDAYLRRTAEWAAKFVGESTPTATKGR